MIGVKLQGRLGNQLFQYAFAYSTARKLKTNFYIDQTDYPFTLPKYFTVPASYYPGQYLFSTKALGRFNFRLKNKWYRLLAKNKTDRNIICAPDEPYESVIQKIQDRTLYTGYFQSELFFKEYSAEIRKLFSLKSRFTNAYKSKYESLFRGKKIITLHIRKDDYAKLGHLALGAEDLSLPFNYYHSVLKRLQSPNSLFVVITDDDKARIQKEFDYLPNVYISRDDLIIDFQHLLNADVCVMANSTFSWWGAWLNENPYKKVYAPEYFMGHHIKKTWPPDIYPSDWEIVTVDTPASK
jgi:hypothetical protein